MTDRDTQNKIVEKIKKLLELATSPNESEARTAMDMAQKLMIKYSIDQSTLANGLIAEAIESMEYQNAILEKTGVIEQMPMILSVIPPIFGVYGIFGTRSVGKRILVKKITLYGFRTNLEIAKFALDSILAQGVAESRTEYRKHRTLSFGLSFWTGFANGLKDKFSSFTSVSDETAIVLYDKVKQHIKSLATGKIGSDLFDGSAYGAGYDAGQKAEIRKGITHTNTGKLLN